MTPGHTLGHTSGRFELSAVERLLRAARMSVLCAGLVGASVLAQTDDYADVNNLIRSGKHTEALAKAEQFLATKPRDPQMRFLRGVAQTESGKLADAVTTFVKLTEDFPELPEPYNNLAVLYANQNQFDRARAALEMAIRTNPSYATAHENLGDVYAKLASQAYSKALQLDGSNPAVQPKLALIRDLFSTARGGKPVAVVAAAPTPTPAPAPAASAAKPAASAAKPAASAPAVVAAAPVASAAKPPASAPVAAPAAPAVAANDSQAITSAVNAWASAWSAKDMRGYLAAYGSDFDPAGGASRKQWEEDRRARIVGKSSISVKLSDIKVTVNGNRATAKFRQDYKADALAVNSAKTLELVKAGDRWVIVKESTGG
jgi:Flp pilus assembly protein TadD/ketosteroid isomerase-like protein